MTEIQGLTPQQLEEIKLWYKYIVNDNNKLQRLSTKKSDLYEAYKKFNDTLEVINSKYTQVEKDSFEIKKQEAEKVLNDENYTSSFLTALCVEWETQTDLANKIMTNSEAYQTLYATAEKNLREDLKAIEVKYN